MFLTSLKKYAPWLVLLALAAGFITWTLKHSPSADNQPQRRNSAPVSVAVAEVTKGNIPVYLTALGTVTPLATVTVKTQIAGQLQQVAFTEGQLVHKGDFLAQIDPRPYQAQLDQDLGQLEKDKALLKEAEIDLERYKVLVAEDSLARQQLDTQTSLVSQYRGAVATDQAMVDAAKLNITYCHIISPIAGRVGLRQVDQGNYVQTSDANGLVVITQLKPITVVFTIPEDSIPTLIRHFRSDNDLPTTALDRSATTKLAEGKVLTVDNEVDTSTGTVKVKAIFDNPDEILFPNQFVNIRVKLDTIEGATIIPNAAVLRGSQGTFAYVVGEDGTVSVRPIKIGQTTADRSAVLDGLTVGEKVVVDGTDKLKEGAKVIISDGSSPPAPQDEQPHKHRKDSSSTGAQE